ncbi:MAG: large repetitive protein [Gaiellales bacterium]|nr:large repetitive protein [Gaiellales bacterium]
MSEEGKTEVRFRATDVAGNVGEWTTPEVVSLDRTAPTAPTISGGGGTWTNSDVSITNNTDATDALSGIGSDGYQYQTSTDGVTWGEAETDATGLVTITHEGATLIRFRAQDEAGNASPWTEPVPNGAGSAMIDKTAPVVPSVTGTTGWINVASFDANATSADTLGAATASGLDHYIVRTSTDGGATYSTPTQSDNVTITDEGVTDVSAAACDIAGNCSDYSSVDASSQVKIDRTAPVVPSVTGSNGWTNATRFDADAVSADTLGAATASGLNHYFVKTSTDGGSTYSEPTQSDTVAITDEGISDVIAAACDAAGNCSGYSPANPGAQVKIDRTAPSTPAVTGGGGAWSKSAVDITNSADSTDSASQIDASGYQFQTSTDNGATWSTPETDLSHVVAVDTEGATLVRFRAQDNAGNASTWTEPVVDGVGSARIDKTAPAVPRVTGTNGWTNVTSFDANATSADTLGAAAASGVDHYMVKTSTDGGATYGTPTQGDTVAVIDEGVTDVSAAACDVAGNCSEYSPTDASAKVQIDRTAPTMPGVSGGGAWSQTAVSITNLADSTDAVSQVDPAGYELQTSTDNGATWSTPEANLSHVVAVDTEGATLVRFRAHDNAGNASTWTESVADGVGSARIDKTAPAVPSVTGTNGWTNVTSFDANATSADTLGAAVASGIDHYLVMTSTDGGATYGTPTQGDTVAVIDEGVTDVIAAACDTAGNCSDYSPADTAANVKIDRTAPSVPGVSGGSSAWSTTAVTVTNLADSTDAVSQVDPAGYELQTSTDNGATWSPAENESSHQVSVTTDGVTLVRFRSQDNAGNASPWTNPGVDGVGSARIDTTAPAVPNVSGTNGWTNAASATATVTSSDTLGAGLSSGIDYYLVKTSNDGGATYSTPTQTGGSSLPITTEGVVDVSAAACDAVGNCSDYSAVDASAKVRIDRTAPTAPGVTGGGAWSKAAVNITNLANATDAVSQVDPAGYQYQTSTNNGTSWSTTQPDAGNTVTVSTEGVTLVRFRSQDKAGNASPWTTPTAGGAGSARIDKTAPAMPTVNANIASTWTNVGSVTATATGGGETAGTAASGFDHYIMRVQNINTSAFVGVDTPTNARSVSGEGMFNATASSCDLAGNCSPFTSGTTASGIYIDRTPPPVPTVSGGDGGNTCTAGPFNGFASSTDALSGVLQYLYIATDDQAVTGSLPSGTNNYQMTWPTFSGLIRIQFAAKDRAGNVSSYSSSDNPGGMKCIIS